MKFTKKEINQWREEFIKRKYPQKVVERDSSSIDYFVMPTVVFQGIPNGLFRMTGNFEDGYLLGVSQEVPEKIQPYFAASEHDEFMVYGLNDSDRTLHSEQSTLESLKAEQSLRSLYIDNKLVLYEHLLRISRDNLEQFFFTVEDYHGFQRAVEFLKDER